MKNFLLVVCLLCCQIIVSQCTLEYIAKRYQIPLEVLTECRDITETLDSNLDEFLATPADHVKSSRKADLVTSVGCFLACVLEKTGLMSGTTIERVKWIERLKSLKDIDSDMVALLVKNVEACPDSAGWLDSACEVAFNFFKCFT